MLHKTNGTTIAEFEQWKLPFDAWQDSFLPWLAGASGRRMPVKAEDWTVASRDYRRRGTMPNVNIFGGSYARRQGAPRGHVQFCEEPAEVQRAVLKAVLELCPMMGFRREDLGFAGYEFGTETVNMARELGIRLVGSMCIHQNWQDGSWGINHTARPLRPYFSASDDFRKAGPGGLDGVVMVSQHDKSILWTEYGLGVFEPAWLERDWVGGGGGGRTVYDDIFMSRHFDLLHASWQNIANQKFPYFASIGIEFSRQDPEEMTTKANALMIRYAVELARMGKVVFCNQTAAGDFYRRHYRETPETLFYDADFWSGIRTGVSISSSWKPADYPDLIQIENSRYSAYFKRPASLPEYHWDYTKPWNYPNWGNETLPRNVMGVLVPGEHDKFAVTPKITDTRTMKVSQAARESSDRWELVVTLETQEPLKALPLALWDIPRAWKPGADWWTLQGKGRFIPVRAPYTGNLNGVLEVDAEPGRNEYHVTIVTPKRTPLSQDLAVGEVHGKVFERDGHSTTYVWPTQPWSVQIELVVPSGRSVQFYAAPEGQRVDLQPGTHALTIPQERWARIVGLRHDELRAALRPTSRFAP